MPLSIIYPGILIYLDFWILFGTFLYRHYMCMDDFVQLNVTDSELEEFSES